MKCATHPEVETGLRCSKCERPICPRCMVETPVGARCPDCARLHKLPTFQVSAKHLWRAVGTSFGMAIICGVIWGVVSSVLPFLLLNLLLGAAAGYAIGEVTSLAVNRKRGSRLAAVAAVAAAVSFVISIMPPWGSFFSPFSIMPFIISLAAAAAAVFIAVSRLR